MNANWMRKKTRKYRNKWLSFEYKLTEYKIRGVFRWLWRRCEYGPNFRPLEPDWIIVCKPFYINEKKIRGNCEFKLSNISVSGVKFNRVEDFLAASLSSNRKRPYDSQGHESKYGDARSLFEN